MAHWHTKKWATFLTRGSMVRARLRCQLKNFIALRCNLVRKCALLTDRSSLFDIFQQNFNPFKLINDRRHLEGKYFACKYAVASKRAASTKLAYSIYWQWNRRIIKSLMRLQFELFVNIYNRGATCRLFVAYLFYSKRIPWHRASRLWIILCNCLANPLPPS